MQMSLLIIILSHLQGLRMACSLHKKPYQWGRGSTLKAGRRELPGSISVALVDLVVWSFLYFFRNLRKCGVGSFERPQWRVLHLLAQVPQADNCPLSYNPTQPYTHTKKFLNSSINLLQSTISQIFNIHFHKFSRLKAFPIFSEFTQNKNKVLNKCHYNGKCLTFFDLLIMVDVSCLLCQLFHSLFHASSSTTGFLHWFCFEKSSHTSVRLLCLFFFCFFFSSFCI